MKKKSILTENGWQFFRNYINNASPVGFETSGQKLWLEYLKPYVDSHFSDPYGTAVGVINSNNNFKVVIEAHADEISWFVNYITPEGLIYLKRNGGVDYQTAPAQRVIIHGKKGPLVVSIRKKLNTWKMRELKAGDRLHGENVYVFV